MDPERGPLIASICARGGSRGVPGKNLRPLLGIPLVGHSVRQARRSGLFEMVSVSSDCPEILEAAGEEGADLLVERPSELASDSAGKLPAIRHNIERAEAHLGSRASIVVDLDATSPLRLVEDIVGAVELLRERGVGNVITGTPARRSPYFNMVEVREGVARLVRPREQELLRRQDCPPVYDMNASIYVWRRDRLFTGGVLGGDTALFEMPPERSFDVDSELDWKIVALLAAERGEL